MITLEQITGRVKDIAPLPPTATRLAAVLSSPSYGIDECAEVVRYDQALTLSIIKYVNSAFSATSRPIADIREAVVRLGGGRILRDLLAGHLRQNLAAELPAYGYSESDLWRHSVASGVAVEMLGRHVALPPAGLSFTAALLHDIGKLILARAAPRGDMEEIWKKVSAEKCACETAEKAVLGLSHAEVGAALLRSWGLPESMAASVGNHHARANTSDSMTDCVMAANLVARSIGEGIGHEGMSVGADAGVAKRLGLSRDKFELVCMESRCRMQEVAAGFGAALQ
jgi:putative nucleotidyltransferase with HDIG domain